MLKHWVHNQIAREQFAHLLNSVLIAMSSRLIESKDFMHLEKKGSFVINKTNINIKDTINEVIGFFSVLAKMQATPFYVFISNLIPPMGVFDRKRLQQIICTLLTNAIRYSN